MSYGKKNVSTYWKKLQSEVMPVHEEGTFFHELYIFVGIKIDCQNQLIQLILLQCKLGAGSEKFLHVLWKYLGMHLPTHVLALYLGVVQQSILQVHHLSNVKYILTLLFLCKETKFPIKGVR